MHVIKKRSRLILMDWLLFVLILYILSNGMRIVLYICHVQNTWSYLGVIIIGALGALKIINRYTSLFPRSVTIHEDHVGVVKFMGTKYIPMSDISLLGYKDNMMPFSKTNKLIYSKDTAFLSRVKYSNKDVFIQTLSVTIEAHNKTKS